MKTAFLGSPRATTGDKKVVDMTIKHYKKCLTVVKSKQVSCQMNLSDKFTSNLFIKRQQHFTDK